MTVRFTYLSFSADQVEKAKEVYSNEVAPVIRGSRGNKDALFLAPEKAGERFISCTTWETETDLKAFEASEDYKRVIGLIRELATGVEQQYYSVV